MRSLFVAALFAACSNPAAVPAPDPAPPTPTVAGPCYVSPADEEALRDPANLLSPFTLPPGYPASVVRGGTLRRAIGADPPSLNPIAAPNAADLVELYRYMGARVALALPHDPDRWTPDLATKVTRSADGLTWDVWLRDGVNWHPVDDADPRHAWMRGAHPVTADDFAFTLELVRDPEVLGRAATLRQQLEALEGIEVVDAHHFRVRFTEDLYVNRAFVLDLEPTPRWLYGHDEDGAPIGTAAVNDHWYGTRGMGAGMYRFELWEPGVRLVLAKNPDHHLAPCLPAAFDRIESRVVKDPRSALARLRAGELDLALVQPAQYAAEVKDKAPYLGDEHLELAVNDEAALFYFAWNEARPMFTDARVREAMTLALDREGLMDGVFAGLGTVVSGPFLPDHPCADPAIAPLPYDPAAAARLLEEAGWVDGDDDGVREKTIDGVVVPFRFTLFVYGGSIEYETLGRVWREALASIGVEMTVAPLEWAAQLDHVGKRDFDAYAGSWVYPWDVDLVQVWHSREADRAGSSNTVGYRDTEADRIADALRRTFDPTERVALCRAFHARVAETQPYTFFFARKRPMLYRDDLNPPVFSRQAPHRDLRWFSFARLPG